MTYALDGGLWLHRFTLRGEAMAHLVSSSRDLLLSAGRLLGMSERWLQYKPLKHPQTSQRVEAWHWDLRGPYLELGLRFAAPRSRGPIFPPSGSRSVLADSD
jgi:hypothetical protein